MSLRPQTFRFEINHFPFDKDGVQRAISKLADHSSWPLVYVLSDEREIYVGETAYAPSRFQTHLNNPEKSHLTRLTVISSQHFNKSAVLNIEAKLISFLLADGKRELLNKNGGQPDHDYFQRTQYEQLFAEVWERLREQDLAAQTLQDISNTDLFKFSPYKSLSGDQVSSVIRVVELLSEAPSVPIFVQGAAGTGKSVLAIFLAKLMLCEVYPQAETADSDNLDTAILERFKATLPNPRIGFVVAMTSLRNTLKTVFRQIPGLSASLVMSPSEASKAKKKFDVLFVDEAHRLRRRKGIGWMGAYDSNNRRLGLPQEADELDWVLLSCKVAILFYDDAQSIRPSDVRPDRFNALKKDATTIELQTQHRSRGGQEFTRFVQELLNDSWEHKRPFDALEGFEVLMFDNMQTMVRHIRDKDSQVGLSRLVAGYSWPWVSKTDKTKFDIEIDGVKLRWNMVADNWINSPTAVNEVGCIHTTQGYDLNYVGVIFGHEIRFDETKNRIVIDSNNYFDRLGKAGVDSHEELTEYIKRIYYTNLSRGIHGVYVYACDAALRNHFKNFFVEYDVNPET